jgi:hypothetical protein
MKRVAATLLMMSQFACAGGENRLKNPGFEPGMEHWQKSGALLALVKIEDGQKILHYQCDGPVGRPGFSQVLVFKDTAGQLYFGGPVGIYTGRQGMARGCALSENSYGDSGDIVCDAAAWSRKFRFPESLVCEIGLGRENFGGYRLNKLKSNNEIVQSLL